MANISARKEKTAVLSATVSAPVLGAMSSIGKFGARARSSARRD